MIKRGIIMRLLGLLIKIFLIILFIQLFNGCVINDSSSLLTIYNNSSNEIKNIKIGEQYITLYLSSGQKYDYYFYSPLKGELTSEGAISAYYHNGEIIKRNGVYTLDLGYSFICRINEADNKTFMYITYDEFDGDVSKSDEYRYNFYKD